MIMLSSGLNAIGPAFRRVLRWMRCWAVCAAWGFVLAGCGEKSPPPGGGQPPKESAAFDAAAQAGQTALNEDQPALAVTHFETALKSATDAGFPASDARLAMTWMFLGTSQARAGDLAAAEKSLTQAQALAQANLADNKQLHADIWFRLGDLYRQMGKADEADKLFAQAAGALPGTDAAVAPLQARILRSQALVQLVLRGNAAAAEPLFQQSLAKLEAVQAAAGPEAVTAGDRAERCALLNDYAAGCLAAKNLDGAAAKLDLAAGIEKDGLADHRVAAETAQLQGAVEMQRKNFGAAETVLTRAVEAFEKSTGPDSAATLRAGHDLAEAAIANNHVEAGRQQYETYVARYAARKTPPARGEPQAYAWVLNRLAGLYVQAEQLDKGLATLDTLQQFYVAHAGPESAVVAQALADRAVILRRLNRGEEADKAEAEAQAIRAKLPPTPKAK